MATAFNRIHRLNNEGGAVFEEWRIENVADRVHTFGTAILGLTIECCRCHDPIPMRDYYSLSAFFNSIDESGVYDRTQKVPCPSLLLPTPEQQAALEAAKQKLAAAESAWQTERDAAAQQFDLWKKQSSDRPDVPDLRLALGFDRPFDKTLKDIYHPSQSDRGWAPMVDVVEVADSPVARLDREHAADKSDGNETRLALKLDGERGITTHGIEPFDRWTPFTVDLWRESNGMSPTYQQSVGQSLYRRSLYSVWKRTAPLPNMMAFDATPREVCTVHRTRTNTPLQALVLLNDVQFVEACRKLAERSILMEKNDKARIAAAFLALTGRSPDSSERATLVGLLIDERVWFTNHKENAAKLLAINRRAFFQRGAIGIGAAALASLIADDTLAATPDGVHFAPTAKRIIYLFQSG